MTRIVLRPIGSPLPLGYFTVAIDNVVTSVLQWGVLPAVDRRAVALIVLPPSSSRQSSGYSRSAPVTASPER
jgi:hypothetical protein